MPLWPDYQLLDFGEGRRLERFGALVLDRPCPAADCKRSDPAEWRRASFVYTGGRGTKDAWRRRLERIETHDFETSGVACRVTTRCGDFQLFAAPMPSGQIGLFPEQFANWQWIVDRVARSHRPLRVLNLFAHTGGSTLAAAVAGADVTHVDASKPAVDRAKTNAEASALGDAPIRWIVEDAVKYCQRELKRESFYDAVILDPPSYGHGPKGEEWRLERDLPTLLELCRDLTSKSRAFLLATCHTPGVGQAELSAYLSDAVVGHCGQPPSAGRLWLTTDNGRKLRSGVYARWPK